MKQIITLIIGCFFTIISFSQNNIYYWDFNTGAGVSPNKWPSPITSTLSASNVTVGTITHNFTKTDNFAGTTIDASGFTTATAGSSFSIVDQINNGNSFILNVPTTNYENIVLTYATQGTASGFTTQTIDYSIDGSNFVNLTSTTVPTAFALKTFDFSAITTVKNNANFKIRITLTGSTSNSGNNRIDNIRVQGSPIITANYVTVTAGNNAAEPNTNGSFNISLNSIAPSPGVTINYSLTGSATLGTDFTDPQNGSVTIPPGSNSGVITLNTLDDILYEPQKNIILTLTSATNGFTISPLQATINLIDNDVTAGVLGTTYNFNTCGNYLQQGFREYSVNGIQKWTCNKVGRTYTVDPSTDSSIVMDGYSSGYFANEDWLISPPFNLIGTNNPTLQFYSRTKYAGASLTLKVSTNYVTGTNPNSATWTTINGNFPSTNTDVWLLSDNINLTSFIGPNVFIAWVYTSTTTAAPRWSLDDIKINAGCTPPSNQATSLNLSSTLNSISGSFTAASPAADGYLVILSNGAPLNTIPTNNTIYAVDDIIGNGTVISINNNTNFTTSNLNPNTSYYITIYAYSALQNCYLLVNPLTGNIATQNIPVCTPPTIQATNLTATNITANSFDLNYTRGNGDNILIIASANTSVSQNPTTGVNYTVGSVIGTGNVVIYNGPAATFSYSTLTQNTTYYFALYEYYNTNFCYNLSPLTGNFTTLCTTPINVNVLSASPSNNQVNLTWNNPTLSCYDEIIVIASTTTIPGVGSDYNAAANNVYTSANQVVYRGTGNSVNVTGLTNGVLYYFKIFTRKGTLYSSGITLSATPYDPAIGFQYFYGNLHSHSSYSDGNKEDLTKKPIDDFRYARDANCMDFLGISEHNHSGAGMNIANFPLGYNDANTVNLELGPTGNTLVTLYGMEWGVISGGGHVLTYGFNDQLIGWEANNYNIFCAKNDYNSLFTLINNQPDAFAMLAHPELTDFGNILGTYSANADNAVVGTAIESGPAFSTNTTYSNFPAPMAHLDYYRYMLAKGYKLGPSMDGDNHYFTFGRQSANRLVVLANSKTRADIMSAIKEMRFYASNDCNVKVDYRCNNNIMGKSISHTGLPTITVSVTDVDAGEATDSILIYGAKMGDPAPIDPIKKYSNLSSIVFDATDVLNMQANNTTYYYYIIVKQADGNAVVTAPIWYTRNDLVLPVSLLQFNANLQTNNTVLLHWTTTQEINNNYFTIEKSIDGGTHFDVIGTVFSVGNSNNLTNYSFTDLTPNIGTNLYRLKQVDRNGSYTYSKIIAINLKNNKEQYYSLYPTVTKHFTTINATLSTTKNIKIQLYNEAGKLLQSLNSNINKNQPVQLNVNDLKNGLYFIKINDGNIIQTRKLIVE